jgi:hypothetical protein
MEPTDLTIEILQGIRDEIRGTNARVDALRDELCGEIRGTNGRLDDTNTRLDRLERRQVEVETRVSTEIVAVAVAVREVRDLLREERALASQVDDHERRIRAIETRTQ